MILESTGGVKALTHGFSEINIKANNLATRGCGFKKAGRSHPFQSEWYGLELTLKLLASAKLNKWALKSFFVIDIIGPSSSIDKSTNHKLYLFSLSQAIG